MVGFPNDEAVGGIKPDFKKKVSVKRNRDEDDKKPNGD